ncbi:MAG: hypothetical protein H8E57_02710 [Candidatus Cloacimonetes bacterium]|nr:hypothetical protein [Candidatus Cloacimonadota bacterium]
MKFIIRYFLSLLLFVSIGCASLSKLEHSTKEKLLTNHLKSWKHLRIDGIVEFNYKSFSFRKNITIRKNEQALRFDIYDAGIMGLHPTPFITAYLDTNFVVRFPHQTKPVDFSKLDPKQEIPDFSFLHNIENLLESRKEIIENRIVEKENFNILFSKKMQIEKVDFVRDSMLVVFDYDLDSKLTKMSFADKKKTIAEIQVDKIDFSEQEFEKLK